MLAIFTKCSILDVRLGSEYARVKFRINHKLGLALIINKITVNRKGKGLARTELRHRHLPWKLLRFWKIILDRVFQNFISTDTIIFKVGNSYQFRLNWCFYYNIFYQDIMHLPWGVRSLLEYLFVKFRFLLWWERNFAIYFLENWNVQVVIFHTPLGGCFWKEPSKQKHV